MSGTLNETSDLPDDTSSLDLPSHSSESAHLSSSSNGSDFPGGSNNVDLHNSSLKRSSAGLDSEQNENNNQCNGTLKLMKLQDEESVKKSLKMKNDSETGNGGCVVNDDDSMMPSSSTVVGCATNAIIDDGNINTGGRSNSYHLTNNNERNREIVQPTDSVCTVSACTGTNDQFTTTEISNSNGNSSSLSTSPSQTDVTLATSIIQPCNHATATIDEREQFTQCINACGLSGAEKYSYLCEFCHEEQLNNMARDDDFVNSLAVGDGRGLSCIKDCGLPGSQEFDFLCKLCYEEQVRASNGVGSDGNVHSEHNISVRTTVVASTSNNQNAAVASSAAGASSNMCISISTTASSNTIDLRPSQPVVDTPSIPGGMTNSTSNFAATSVSDIARSSSPVNTSTISPPVSSSSQTTEEDFLFSDLFSRPVPWHPSQSWHPKHPWLSKVPPGFTGLTNFNPGFNFGSTASSHSSTVSPLCNTNVTSSLGVAITTLSSSVLSSVQNTSSHLVPLNVNPLNPVVTCGTTVTSSSHVVGVSTSSQQTVHPGENQVQSSVARLGVYLCDVECDHMSGLMSFSTRNSSSDIFRKIIAELVQLHNDSLRYVNNLQPEQRKERLELSEYLRFRSTSRPPNILLKLLSSGDPSAAHSWQNGPLPPSPVSNSSQPPRVCSSDGAAAVASQTWKTWPLHTPHSEGQTPTSDIQSSSAQLQQHGIPTSDMQPTEQPSTQTSTHPSTISNNVESASRENCMDFVLQGIQNIRRQWDLRDALALFNLENEGATGLLRVLAPPATNGTSAMYDQDQLMVLAHLHNQLLMSEDGRWYKEDRRDFIKIRNYLLLGPNSGRVPSIFSEGKTAAELAAVARSTWGWPTSSGDQSNSSNTVYISTTSASSRFVRSRLRCTSSPSPNMVGASCSASTVTGKQHLTATGISSGATGGDMVSGGSACATFSCQDHGKSKCIQHDNAGASNKELHTDSDYIPIPIHWPGNCALGQRIKAPQHAYNSVKTAFERAIGVPGITVKNIEEICNVEFFEKYEIQRRNMKQKLSGNDQVNERLLYHGTSANVIDDICVQNFDPRMSSTNAAQWGKGSYFARDAAYSHSYSVVDDTSTKYMFLARVLVGRSTLGDKCYLRPPPIPGQAHRLFDSCVNNIEHPSIFVIFDRDHCYPRYLISYR